MVEQTSTSTQPESGSTDNTRIGVDDWVAQVAGRRRQRAGLWGLLAGRWAAIPLLWRIGLVALLLILAPFVTNSAPVLSALGISNNDFIVRVGATFLAFSILAIGLNVVVGYAGLLDLGYVAFFGLAGYAYAYLSSDFVGDGIHLPSIISLPLIVIFTALVGWLLGSLAIRLYGDYLAIVTLGFGLLFFQLAQTLTRVKFFWLERPVDLTRGPNGINNLDEIAFFGYEFKSTLQYYFLFLALLGLVVLVVHHLNQSRLGRGWRAMREDELAAEVMGMPARRLKLMAFAIGAAIAALVGVVFAAWQGNVAPIRYNVLALINLYAMIVLGGLGSLPGVIIGAFIFTVLPEILRDVAAAGFLFYVGGLLGLSAWLKPSRRLVLLLGGVILAGILLKLLVNLAWPWVDVGRAPAAGSFLNEWAQAWLVIPTNFQIAGNIAIGGAVLTLLLTLWVKNGWRWLWLGLSIYLFVFAWETRLATEPAITRILVLGSALVVLMITRPQGMLGRLRVEVV
jgi:branched-chain amino acid transport system permease protein